MQSSLDQVRDNIERHERIASSYDQVHEEIYNDVEQQRLDAIISHALQLVDTGSETTRVMDLGCGAGNLTRHLLHHGCSVTAADVTPSFVSMVVATAPSRVDGLLLNGSDLGNVADCTYDMVATYSVLHHIPDYLSIVREMARIVKPGGIVFIDHERSHDHWAPTPALLEYRTKTKQPRSFQWHADRLLRPRWWHTRWKQLFDSRYQEEGDIHVWPDDHIEWASIEAALIDSNCEIVYSEDYLMYEPHVDRALFEAYKNVCNDLHCCIARRKR